MSVRDYQQAAHDSVLAAWGEKPWHTEGDTFREVLVNLTTSAGKTYISGMLITSMHKKAPCLFLADTDELCEQPRRTFYKKFGIHAALEKAGDRASMLADVVVGSAQTLQREDRLHRFPANHFGYIFVDEAHRGSERNKAITNHFTAAKVCGMTATAFRGKTSTRSGLADLSDFYEHVAFELGMFDLIGEGYIAPISVLTLPVKVDISKVHQRSGDYDPDELHFTIRPYYEEICRLILEHAPGRQIVAFLPLIRSSQEFVQVAQSFGISACHVDGKSEDRRAILARFEQKQFQLLSNSSLLTTGWDCPTCDCLLNLAPTRSMGLFRQKVGRIGRLLPGVIDGIEDKEARKAAIAASAKPDALILDLLWQTEKFGLMGPSDLIAANADERGAIQKALAGLRSPADLEDVAARVQEAREAALKRALIEAAKRRSSFNDAINLVAAMLHGRAVTNYEPVVEWHGKPVTAQQKEWLTKNGVDPASATDRGHASAFMNLMFGRKKAGLCNHRAVEALEREGIPGAISMKTRQAFELLQGKFPITFGKHARTGKPLQEIGASYWEWCMKEENRRWFNASKYPIEFEWAKSVGIDPAEERCTCIGSHQGPNCPKHPREPVLAPAAEENDDDEIPF